MKSIKVTYLTFGLLTVAGAQLNAMHIPTQVGPHATFMSRIGAKNPVNFFASQPNIELNVSQQDTLPTAHEIQVQQELLDVTPVVTNSNEAFLTRAQNAVKAFASKATEKATQFGSAVAEKAKVAYNSQMVQNSFAKAGQAGKFVSAKINAALQSKMGQKVTQKANMAYDFVKENPKLVAGVTAGLVATYGIYKAVSYFNKVKHSDVVPADKVVVTKQLTPEEEAQLPAAMASSVDGSVLDPEHVAQMNAEQKSLK